MTRVRKVIRVSIMSLTKYLYLEVSTIRTGKKVLTRNNFVRRFRFSVLIDPGSVTSGGVDERLAVHVPEVTSEGDVDQGRKDANVAFVHCHLSFLLLKKTDLFYQNLRLQN